MRPVAQMDSLSVIVCWRLKIGKCQQKQAQQGDYPLVTEAHDQVVGLKIVRVVSLKSQMIQQNNLKPIELVSGTC